MITSVARRRQSECCTGLPSPAREGPVAPFAPPEAPSGRRLMPSLDMSPASLAGAASSRRDAAPRRRIRRLFGGWRMHQALFVALTAISAVPVLGLATWVERTAVERELASVHEKHLLVAKNLTNAL